MLLRSPCVMMCSTDQTVDKITERAMVGPMGEGLPNRLYRGRHHGACYRVRLPWCNP